MIKIRKSKERGHYNHRWLDTYHTFSFADYHDPDYMGFRALRVINEDRVRPGEGFGMHSHRDMEIITYILKGSLEHKDSMGNTSVIKPGEVQRMSAGAGVTHSEFNPSQAGVVHLLQIWILPAEKGLQPSYEQKNYGALKKDSLRLVASPTGKNGSVKIHQDALMYDGRIGTNKPLAYRLAPGRGVWLQLIEGSLNINGTVLHEGDGAAIEGESKILLKAEKRSKFLLFDLN